MRIMLRRDKALKIRARTRCAPCLKGGAEYLKKGGSICCFI